MIEKKKTRVARYKAGRVVIEETRLVEQTDVVATVEMADIPRMIERDAKYAGLVALLDDRDRRLAAIAARAREMASSLLPVPTGFFNALADYALATEQVAGKAVVGQTAGVYASRFLARTSAAARWGIDMERPIRGQVRDGSETLKY